MDWTCTSLAKQHHGHAAAAWLRHNEPLKTTTKPAALHCPGPSTLCPREALLNGMTCMRTPALAISPAQRLARWKVRKQRRMARGLACQLTGWERRQSRAMCQRRPGKLQRQVTALKRDLAALRQLIELGLTQ